MTIPYLYFIAVLAEETPVLPPRRVQKSKLFPVRGVIGLKYRKLYDRFYFVTEWEAKDNKGNFERDAIPLENFLDSPEPICSYVRKLWAENNNQMPLLSDGHKKTVADNEYVPKSGDKIRKVYYLFTTKVGRNYHEFYCVRLHGVENPKIVRLTLMEFFFRCELLLFWRKNNRSGPRWPEKN